MTERGDLTVQRPQVAEPCLGANPAVAVREPAGLLIRERVTRRADCSASGQGLGDHRRNHRSASRTHEALLTHLPTSGNPFPCDQVIRSVTQSRTPTRGCQRRTAALRISLPGCGGCAGTGRALPVPKISSAQVGAAIRFRRRPPELVALLRSARCGMMIGCAASTGLSECDERVRVTAATSDERPGQGHGDPGAAPPDHGPGAAAG